MRLKLFCIGILFTMATWLRESDSSDSSCDTSRNVSIPSVQPVIRSPWRVICLRFGMFLSILEAHRSSGRYKQIKFHIMWFTNISCITSEKHKNRSHNRVFHTTNFLVFLEIIRHVVHQTTLSLDYFVSILRFFEGVPLYILVHL